MIGNPSTIKKFWKPKYFSLITNIVQKRIQMPERFSKNKINTLINIQIAFQKGVKSLSHLPSTQPNKWKNSVSQNAENGIFGKWFYNFFDVDLI